MRPVSPAFTRDGKAYFDLGRQPGVAVEIDGPQQALRLNVAPDRLEGARLVEDSSDRGEMTRSGFGAFLNYDLVGTMVGGETSFAGQIETGLFTPMGVAINRLVARSASDGSAVTRLETNWTMDDPARMRSIRLGDAITRGGVGGAPVRFGGIQLARNFAVQPGYVTFPMPTLRSSAALPSVVDLYVNNALRSSRGVQPGPFEIANTPILTGGGDVRLVVRDLLGRETIVTQSYYASPRLLRRGLHDYAFEAGFLRQDFGSRSFDYGAPFVSTTQRLGISDSVTGEAHLEVAPDVQMMGVGGDFLAGRFGLFDVSIAASHSDRGTGAQASVAFERRTSFFSFGAHAAIASADFAALGLLPYRRAPSLEAEAFASLPLGGGSLGLTYLLRRAREEPDAELLGASYSFRLGRLGNLFLAARKNFTGRREEAGELVLVVPLGNRTSASARLDQRDGAASLAALVQKAAPVGAGWGYRVGASVGALDRVETLLRVQSDFGVYEAELTWTDRETGLRLSTSGGIALIGGSVFASRQLGDSFARVKVGNQAGVKIFAENQPVATTNRRGEAIVPNLRAYDRNAIRIDITELPLDTELASAEREVRPYGRSGVDVDFEVRPARAALLRLVGEDGAGIPPGATIRLDGRDQDFVSAPRGEVYLTGLGRAEKGEARWPGGRCRFAIDYRPTDEVQPQLGDIQCRSVAG
jgi:outer membrane usher protein